MTARRKKTGLVRWGDLHIDNDKRQFPIQSEWDETEHRLLPVTYIPWWLAELAYEYYTRKFGTHQSLERLAERGGFGRREVVAYIRQDISELFK